MTRKIQNPGGEDGRRRKRVLKPVVEKKRRDRINHSLAELRSLLLSQTSDARLQNPKVEKAEILDLTVEFLQRWTEEKKHRSDHRVKPPAPSLHSQQQPEGPPLSMESAGFQQCVAQLSSYIQRMAPSQQLSLVEGLQQQQQQQQQDAPAAGCHCRRSSDTSEGLSEGGDGPGHSPRFFLFPSLSPSHPLCSTPCHDHTSPPPSPWLSPCFSTFAASPSFPSFGPLFSPPLSSNTSLFSSSNTSFFCFPPPTALRHPPHPVTGGAAPPNPSPFWRPW